MDQNVAIEELSYPDWANKFTNGEVLSYDDILLAPQRSSVDSRSNVSLRSNITPSIEVDVPIISSPMDTVTEVEMAQEMHNSGAVGIIHRFMEAEEQANQIEDVNGTVGGSVGINDGWEERASLLVESGADFLCVDVAHGHLESALSVVEMLSDVYPDIDLMAGNVATPRGALDLASAGADAIKVGIGPGSHCTTREVAGVGVPQFSSVLMISLTLENSQFSDGTLVADGGIQQSGDIVKALMAGADSVMVGSLVGGCKESPAPTVRIDGRKYKATRGMASEEAKNSDVVDGGEAVEGSEALTEYNGNVADVIAENSEGIRSGLSYCGGTNIQEARDSIRNAEIRSPIGGYIEVSSHTELRNGIHGVRQRQPDESR